VLSTTNQQVFPKEYKKALLAMKEKDKARLFCCNPGALRSLHAWIQILPLHVGLQTNSSSKRSIGN